MEKGGLVARIDGRADDQLRQTSIVVGYQEFAEGSALVEMGKTRVLCAVSLDDRVPPFLRGLGKGWITAEYSMLPRATQTRTPRESTEGRQRGRSQEIQRLIGRSLRAAVDLKGLGERSLQVDCDVLQADGGTRTASITGAYVALYQALLNLQKRGILSTVPLRSAVAAVSAGLVGGRLLLDLCYEEDSQAEVDFTLVMTDQGELVEVQGTAEGKPFAPATLDDVLRLARKGTESLFQIQRAALLTLR